MNIYSLLGIHGVEPKRNFERKIFDHYQNLSNGKIPFEILKQISYLIAYDQYEDYKRFWGKYPKSRKRYSKFQLKDLDHPQVHEKLVEFFKEKYPSLYFKYSSILMETNEKGVLDFIKRRNEFYNMF